MKRLIILVVLSLLVYVGTGLYTVQPDEQAMVRRFGRVLAAPSEPGLHFGLPMGLDRIDRIKPREVKRVTIGPLNLAGGAVGSSPPQFLTGDRNLVNVRATIQFTIKDPSRYLFRTAEVNGLVASAGESTLTGVLAGESVDRSLTLGKQQVSIESHSQLQTLVDQYGLGISIRSFDIGDVQPPAEVAEAFAQVISALRKREQQINLAHSYANRTREEAKATAQQVHDEALSERDQVVRKAQGQAERFEKLLVEYERSPELTAQRLYLETMAETLPKFRSKLIIDSGSDLDLSIIREENR